MPATAWHYRIYRWMQTSPQSEWRPTVCGYWATVLIGFPIVCVMVTILGPLVWVVDKLEKRFKGKTICPFGYKELPK